MRKMKMTALTLKSLNNGSFLVCVLIKGSLLRHMGYAQNIILPVTMLCRAFTHGFCKVCLFTFIFFVSLF